MTTITITIETNHKGHVGMLTKLTETVRANHTEARMAKAIMWALSEWDALGTDTIEKVTVTGDSIKPATCDPIEAAMKRHGFNPAK